MLAAPHSAMRPKTRQKAFDKLSFRLYTKILYEVQLLGTPLPLEKFSYRSANLRCAKKKPSLIAETTPLLIWEDIRKKDCWVDKGYRKPGQSDLNKEARAAVVFWGSVKVDGSFQSLIDREFGASYLSVLFCGPAGASSAYMKAQKAYRYFERKITTVIFDMFWSTK